MNDQQKARPAPTGAARALQVTNLTKAFGGIVALDNVDFAASPGEVHALLGENGAGKSTLIKALTGAICADAGEIRPDGAPITLHNPRQARAGSTRQGSS